MRRLMITTRCVMLVVFGLMVVLSIPAAAAAPWHQDSTPVTLRVAMPAPTDLDPVRLSRFDPTTHDLVENLFVGLTRTDPITQQIEPMIARDWSVSPDGLIWTFNLRDDIQWVRTDPTTGQTAVIRPVVAGDFVYAIHRACDPRRPSPITANLMIIQGCQIVAHTSPQVIDDLFIAQEMGVRAVGPNTLEVTLLFPASYFLTLVSTPEYRPLSREAVSESETWAAASTLITNGPYVLQTWNEKGMSLARNPAWPDPYSGNITQVDITFTDDTLTAATLIANQRVDMARLSPDQANAAHTAYPDLFHTAAGSSLVMLGFSYDRALVGTVEVRRALALALDRQALIDQVFPDQALPAEQFTPPGVVAAPVSNGTLFNPAQAQADFSTAGYPACADIPEKLIVLVPDDDPIWTELGQAIIQQWSVQLGCNTGLFELKTVPRALLIEMSHATYDTETVTRSHIWLAFWSEDYPDANAWIGDALHCQYGYIRMGRECGETDALLDQAALEPDTARRADLYTQAEQQFFGPAGTFPVIPLTLSASAWLQQPWLAGVNAYGAARFDLWTIDTQTRPH